MKIIPGKPGLVKGAHFAGARGFSLVEVLVAGSVAVLIGGALVASQLFADRMWQISQTKINTTDQGRQILRLLRADVQEARCFEVGEASSATFTPATFGSAQEGNGVQLWPLCGTAAYVRYYFEDGSLKRVTNGGVPAVISSGISPGAMFSLQDIQGNILTQMQTDAVVAFSLSYAKLTNPDAEVGPSQYYKSYQLSGKFAPPHN